MKKVLSWILAFLFTVTLANFDLRPVSASGEDPIQKSFNKPSFETLKKVPAEEAEAKAIKEKIAVDSNAQKEAKKWEPAAPGVSKKDMLMKGLRQTNATTDAVLGDLYEMEPNGYLDLADTIYLDYRVHGSLGYNNYIDDMDVFKLTVSESGVLAAVGILDYLSSYTSYLRVYLYNSSGARISSSYYDSSANDVWFEYNITPGTYYIGVFNGTTDQYTGDYMYGTSYTFLTGLFEEYSTDSTLSSIKVDGISVPNFNKYVYSYNVNMPTNPSSYSITATTTDLGATYLVSYPAALPGTAYIYVTAEDGVTQSTYTLNFLQPKSSNAQLAGIQVNGNSIPNFNANTLSYTYALPANTQSVQITATKGQAGQSLAITNPVSFTGTGTVVVTAEDGVTKNTYSIKFELAITPNAPTANPAPGTLVPGSAVTLSCSTTGASIYYTTNGSTPTASSATYTTPITVTADTTIKAIAIKNGVSSSVSAFAYKVSGTPGITAMVAKDSATGTLYLYDYTALRNDYLKYQQGTSSLLFNHYVNKIVVAFKDGAKGYLDYDNIRNGYVNSQQQGLQFNLDTYIQSQSIPYTMPASVKRVTLVNGVIVEENYTP
jgi:hypothetical protein